MANQGSRANLSESAHSEEQREEANNPMVYFKEQNSLHAEEEKHPVMYGVLAVHIKGAQNLFCDQFLSTNINMYTKVTVRNLSKTTHLTVSSGNNMTWSEIKHFPLTIMRNPKHPFNLVKLEVYGFEKEGDRHEIVGTLAFHLHDIIRASPVTGQFDLYQHHQLVGLISLELAFAYGIFGYGCSDQLADANRTPDDRLANSLFPRIEPPVERCEDILLSPQVEPHPSWIPFASKAHISYGKDFKKALNKLSTTQRGKFPLVTQLYARVKAVHNEYLLISDRHEKLAFLRSRIHEGREVHECMSERSYINNTNVSKPYDLCVRPLSSIAHEYKISGAMARQCHNDSE